MLFLISCINTDETVQTGDKNPSPYSPGTTFIDLDADFFAFEDVEYVLDGEALINDLDSSKTYSFSAQNLPIWAVIDSSTAQISGTPNANVTHNDIVIIATNTLNPLDTASSSAFSIAVNGDPLRFSQWHLDNTAQNNFAANSGIAGVDINIADTYSIGVNGEDVKIAISDGGVEINHADLQTNLISGASKDYTLDPPYFGFPTPSGSHGTAVTGIIAARGWNNLGITGVAPYAKFGAFQFLQSSQNASIMIDQASGGFDIYNYSYGDTLLFDTLSDANYIDHLRYQTQNARDSKGAFYVKSAGNEFILADNDTSPTLCAPHNANLPFENESPYLIVVGALNALGTKATYSNAGSNIWVTAPGGDYGFNYPAILSTDLPTCLKGRSKASTDVLNSFEYGHALNSSCDYTSTMNGTSASAPVVSGVIALLLDANSNLSYRDAKHILALTAQKVDLTNNSFSRDDHPSLYLSSCPSLKLTGHDYELGWITNSRGISFNNFYGFGLVDVKEAVSMAQDFSLDPLNSLPLGDLVESNPDFNVSALERTSLSLAIPDEDKDGVEDAITISGAVSFLESIQVKISATHPRSGEIGVELTSPSGTKSILLNINNSLLLNGDSNLNIVLTSHAFYGENPNGTWTIKIIDGRSGSTGSLNSWKLNLLGHN